MLVKQLFDYTTIALIGNTNVGKSTLFNVLTGKKNALISEVPGTTRDYIRGVCTSYQAEVIDTGGIDGKDCELHEAVLDKTKKTMALADVLFLVVDPSMTLERIFPLMPYVRQYRLKMRLVVNKSDQLSSYDPEPWRYVGLSDPIFISAKLKKGIEVLMQDIPVAEETPSASPGIAIIGRPNVGKSTLINCFASEARAIVSDIAGTTRDILAIDFKNYTLMDTPGLRRSSAHQAWDTHFLNKVTSVIKESQCVILVVDAKEAAVDQDMRLMQLLKEKSKSFVIAVNKSDLLTIEEKNYIRERLMIQLRFVRYIPLFFISALTGNGVGLLWKRLLWLQKQNYLHHSTNQLTKILQKAVLNRPLRHVKLQYAHVGMNYPPKIVIHGRGLERIPETYRRYLSNFYAQSLNIIGISIAIKFKI